MDKQTYKIAVVGNRDAILPFRLIGFQTYPVTEPQEAINTLRKLSRENFGIIYLLRLFQIQWLFTTSS